MQPEFAGYRAPTLTFSPLVGLELLGQLASSIQLPLREDFEYGLLSLKGELKIEGDRFATNELAYLGRGRRNVTLELPAGRRAILVGG